MYQLLCAGREIRTLTGVSPPVFETGSFTDYDTPAFRLQWRKEKLISELDKCILLCSNCHIETHNQASPEGFEPPAFSLED